MDYQVILSASARAELLALDASLFHEDWSGSIEYRYQTSKAAQIIKWIHDLTQT